MVAHITREDITELIGITLFLAFCIAIWPVTALVAEYTLFCNIWEERHDPDSIDTHFITTRTYVIASIVNIVLTILWFMYVL